MPPHRSSGGPDWNLERLASRQGYARVAGIDEAGRGCLFGPVFASAVILDPAAPLPGLDDSKRVSPARRDLLDSQIRETCIAFSIQAVDAASIDLVNILEASRLAMKRAAESLDPAPDFLLVDAVSVETRIPQRSIVKGDRKSRSIAAASILAKVARDRCILAWDSLYPRYGLRSNKGYPARAHVAAIRKHGCTPLHRQSFGPVARLAALDPRVPLSGYTVSL